MRRRLCAVAAAMLIVVAGPTGRAVAATPGGEPPAGGPFTVSPVPEADGLARGYFQLSAEPGGSVTDVVVFGNQSDQTQRLRVGVTNGVTASNSGSAYGALSNSCAGVACWVNGIPGTITLPPHGEQEVEFRAEVPAGTRPAQYLAGITATSVPPVSLAPAWARLGRCSIVIANRGRAPVARATSARPSRIHVASADKSTMGSACGAPK